MVLIQLALILIIAIIIIARWVKKNPDKIYRLRKIIIRFIAGFIKTFTGFTKEIKDEINKDKKL